MSKLYFFFIGADGEGHPTIDATDCEAHLSDMDLKFTDTSAKYLQDIATLLKPLIKTLFQTKVRQCLSCILPICRWCKICTLREFQFNPRKKKVKEVFIFEWNRKYEFVYSLQLQLPILLLHLVSKYVFQLFFKFYRCLNLQEAI